MIKKTLLEANNQMKHFAKQQEVMDNNQAMMQVPNEVREI